LVDWVAPLIQPVDFEAAPGEEHKWYKMMGAAHLLPPQEKLSYHALPDDPAQALNILREAAGLEPLP
jgi:hypothetical protein